MRLYIRVVVEIFRSGEMTAARQNRLLLDCVIRRAGGHALFLPSTKDSRKPTKSVHSNNYRLFFEALLSTVRTTACISGPHFSHPMLDASTAAKCQPISISQPQSVCCKQNTTYTPRSSAFRSTSRNRLGRTEATVTHRCTPRVTISIARN